MLKNGDKTNPNLSLFGINFFTEICLMKTLITLMSVLLLIQPSLGQKVIPGAERTEVYVPMLKGKKVGIFANQTSMVGRTHLVDTLRSLGVDVRVIFGPEHGFRGVADAGEKVGNYIDEKTGVPVVSLYGPKRNPLQKTLPMWIL